MVETSVYSKKNWNAPKRTGDVEKEDCEFLIISIGDGPSKSTVTMGYEVGSITVVPSD